MFRSNYGSQIDLVDTDIAIYHDALHGLTGLGISVTDEIEVQNIECFLRGEVLNEQDLEKVQKYLRMIPEPILGIFEEFYSKN